MSWLKVFAAGLVVGRWLERQDRRRIDAAVRIKLDTIRSIREMSNG